MLAVKTDAKLKKKAQQVARDLGLPLGTIVNRYLQQLVTEQRIVFERPEIPNAETRKAIEETIGDLKKGKHMITFKNTKEMDDYLLSL